MYENNIYDQQNNPNLNNRYSRNTKKTIRTIHRPLTSQFQTTFNPFSYDNGNSIPLILNKTKNRHILNQITFQKAQHDHFFRPQVKGPVIARNLKLKNFFAQQSARYSKEKLQGQRKTARSLKFSSLQVGKNRQCPKQQLPKVKKQSLNQKTRKQQFEQVYLHQKEMFQELLSKYGVNMAIDQSDFLNFMREA